MYKNQKKGREGTTQRSTETAAILTDSVGVKTDVEPEAVQPQDELQHDAHAHDNVQHVGHVERRLVAVEAGVQVRGSVLHHWSGRHKS